MSAARSDLSPPDVGGDLRFVVKRVFNNSVVLAADPTGAEQVLLGRGIGFHVRPGEPVDPTLVDKVFVLQERGSAERLAALLSDLSLVEIEAAQEVLREAREALGDHISDHVFLPLADHVVYAVRRARDGQPAIDYQLRWEVQHLYPAEVEFSRRALDLIHERLGVRLPDAEAVPMALHFVNAQFGSTDIGGTIRMTEVLAEILGQLATELGVEVDEDSLDVARFVSHLRYLFMRGRTGAELAATPPGVVEAVRSAQPLEHAAAVGIARLLQDRFGWPATDEETLYLTLHVARLRASGRRTV
ncbi:PRD domain-containing protein [Actinotalea sp. M2MS4P-6]|uniref:PRD domain-containing protein n=1 Tax=Actinotalea sp. M2MS4P-6 TaxID=2983762 RepID=UPI0021E4F1E6|nr:PRD domain-containing protein [Actinotalea sp. M2MS4P-6]MCV2394453.1 PRD domain-containing protein [Actinotalea sp. M2MS4P-6]